MDEVARWEAIVALLASIAEASVALVPAPDFKSGGSRGDTAPAGSIPVRFRHLHPKITCSFTASTRLPLR
jgi:hypothetical protein